MTLAAPRHALAAGDTAEMVAARESVLTCGHFAPVTDALIAAAGVALGGVGHAVGVDGADGATQTTIVDLGAGTGHHLAGLLRARPRALGIALDSSRPALRRALHAHPRIAAVVCDVWGQLPVRSSAVDLAINVFAPRNGPEIARLLKRDGALIVVTPRTGHLEQIVGRLGMLTVGEHKQARLETALAPALELIERRDLDFTMMLAAREIEALIAMGPSAHHLDRDSVRARLAGLQEGRTEVTGSVSVETFRVTPR